MITSIFISYSLQSSQTLLPTTVIFLSVLPVTSTLPNTMNIFSSFLPYSTLAAVDQIILFSSFKYDLYLKTCASQPIIYYLSIFMFISIFNIYLCLYIPHLSVCPSVIYLFHPPFFCTLIPHWELLCHHCCFFHTCLSLIMRLPQNSVLAQHSFYALLS